MEGFDLTMILGFHFVYFFCFVLVITEESYLLLETFREGVGKSGCICLSSSVESAFG